MNSKTVFLLLITLIFGLGVNLMQHQLNFSANEIKDVEIHDNVRLVRPVYSNNNCTTFKPMKYNHIQKGVFVSNFRARHTDNMQSFLSTQSYLFYQSAPEQTPQIQSVDTYLSEVFPHASTNNRIKSHEGAFNDYKTTSFDGLKRFINQLPEKKQFTKSSDGVLNSANTLSTPFSNNTIFSASNYDLPPDQGDNPEGEPMPLGDDVLNLSCLAMIYSLIKFLKRNNQQV